MPRFDLSVLCVLSFFARSVYKMPYEESLLVTQKLECRLSVHTLVVDAHMSLLI